jgi:hypothetical protein
MMIEIVSIKPKIIDTKYVSMQILIDYDTEFKECISVILNKKNVSRLDVELFVSKALQKVIEELDDDLQLPEES